MANPWVEQETEIIVKGKKEGEIAEIQVPNGIIKLEINKITRE